MFSSTSLSLRKFFQRQFLLPLAVLVLNTITIGTLADENRPKELKVLSWGERCKIPQRGESLKPSERCDVRKGTVCQKYSEGDQYCGCDMRSTETSYDHGSKECRLKVGYNCRYVNVTAEPDSYARLQYNDKCHDRAQCKNELVMDKQGNYKKSEYTKCICKEGYIHSGDSCADPNLATSTSVNCILSSLALLFVFVRLIL